MTRETMTLADGLDAYHFTVGMPLKMVETSTGKLTVRPATRWERFRAAIADWWLSWTRWLRPRTVTSAVDVGAGSITLVTERWSWRRWRAERA